MIHRSSHTPAYRKPARDLFKKSVCPELTQQRELMLHISGELGYEQYILGVAKPEDVPDEIQLRKQTQG